MQKSRNISRSVFALCCHEEKIYLPFLKETPAFLGILLDHSGGKRALKIWDLMGAKIDNAINRKLGSYIFHINSQNHHRMGLLLSINEKKSKFV